MKLATPRELEEWKVEKAELVLKKLKAYCEDVKQAISRAYKLEYGLSYKLSSAIEKGCQIVKLVHEARDYGILTAFQPDKAYLCNTCVKLYVCSIPSGYVKKLRKAEEKCSLCNEKALYYAEKLSKSGAYFLIEKLYKKDAYPAYFCAECFLFMIDHIEEIAFVQSREKHHCCFIDRESEFRVLTAFIGEVPEPLFRRLKPMRLAEMPPTKAPPIGPIPLIEAVRKCREPEELAERVNRLLDYLPDIVKEEVTKQVREKVEEEVSYLKTLLMGKRNVGKAIIELLRAEGALKPFEIAERIKAKYGTVRVLLWRLTKKGVVKNKRGRYTLNRKFLCETSYQR